MSSISITCERPVANSLATAKCIESLRMGRPMWYGWLALLGLGSAAIAAALSLYIQPSPRIHDEFSYMLAADTLLHGRLANPTPPAWEALQSFHTVMQPSYASKYPIGSGLQVAIGWLLLGTPLASSWLAAALLTVCVTWMLAGVLPKQWAALGGLLISLSPFIQLAWSQSLLNGFVPASGSALLLGGVLRLRRRVVFSNAFASGMGIGILAISRPFEGLCCTLICASLLWLAWNKHRLQRRWWMAAQVSASAFAPILAAIVLIASHNHAVTGDWRKMPYQSHESQYGVAPLFVFSSPRLENTVKRTGLPEVFHDYHAVDSLNWYRHRIGVRGWLQGVSDASRELTKMSFPFAAVLAVSGFGWTRYRLTRSLLGAIALQIAASACVCWVYSHYLAPILPWILLLSLIGIRQSLRRRTRFQYHIVRWSIATVLTLQVACIVMFAGVAQGNEAELWSRHRQDIVHQLTASEGKHLILVQYRPDHNVHQEWVYNLATPSESKLVWARYEGGRWLESLLDAYPNRKVWVVDADSRVPCAQPFSELERQSKQNPGDTSGH